MMKPHLLSFSALALFAFGCSQPSSTGNDDPCAAATAHVQTCFPDREISPPASCDAALAERLLESSCDEMQRAEGKADGDSWWCTPWTWWMCGSSSGGGNSPQRLESWLNGPRALTGDYSALYYVLDDPTQGQIVRYTKSSGTTKVLAKLQASPRKLAVDASYVYWINYGDYDGVSALMRVARTDGVPELLASGGPRFLDLALDASDIYISGDGGVYRLPKAGGALERLSDLGVADYKSAPSIALDDEAVYVIDSWSDSRLHRVAKADGARTLLATNTSVSALAVDAQYVYWFAGDAGLQRVEKTGGAVETLGSSSRSGSEAVVIASPWVYVTDHMGDRVLRLPLTGGDEEVLASGQSGPMGLVVDGKTIYWTNEGTYRFEDYNRDGELMKLTLD